jgi:hypothetical protein
MPDIALIAYKIVQTLMVFPYIRFILNRSFSTFVATINFYAPG